ncbi:MAG: hypothetical protein ACK6CT_08690, partial [Planctomycetia bacterium]
MLELSPQAQQNLKLVSRPAKLSNYWRSVIVPGEITDRPGMSDSGVTSPAVGVVTQIHAFAGDTVRPGGRLFTLRLVSEYIHNTQSELFKVTRDIELETEKRQRLSQIGEGAIPQVRIIEVDQQLRRLQAASESYRKDLLTRGLNLDQIAQVAAGKFGPSGFSVGRACPCHVTGRVGPGAFAPRPLTEPDLWFTHPALWVPFSQVEQK